MIQLIVNGFVLGFVSSPTCPSNAEELRWGSLRGFRPAFMVGLGAVAGDALVLLVALLGLYPLLQSHPSAQALLWLFAGLVLVWMGWQVFRESAEPSPGIAAPAPAVPSPERADVVAAAGTPFLRGLVITALNPFTLIWWVGILGASSLVAGTIPLLFAVAVLLGSLAWFGGLAIALHFGRAYTAGGFRRWLLRLSGVVLIGYGVWLLSHAVGLVLA